MFRPFAPSNVPSFTVLAVPCSIGISSLREWSLLRRQNPGCRIRQKSRQRGRPVASSGFRRARRAALHDDLLVAGLPVLLLGQGVLGAELSEQGVDELPEAGPGRAVGEEALVLHGPGDQRNQERHLGRRQLPRLPAEVGAGGGPGAVLLRGLVNRDR